MAQSLNPKPLSSWRWQDIQRVYAVLGEQIKEYQRIKRTFKVPRTVDINYSDQKNIVILRFWRDVTRINKQLAVLDIEIARRNQLLGVMG